MTTGFSREKNILRYHQAFSSGEAAATFSARQVDEGDDPAKTRQGRLFYFVESSKQFGFRPAPDGLSGRRQTKCKRINVKRRANSPMEASASSTTFFNSQKPFGMFSLEITVSIHVFELCFPSVSSSRALFITV